MVTRGSRYPWILHVAFAGLVMTITSCGGGGDADSADEAPAAEEAAAAAAEAPDACALLAADAAAEALGEPAGAPQPLPTPPLGADAAAAMSACNYPAAGSPKSIGVTAWRATNGMYSSEGLEGARQTLREATGQAPEEIAGLGIVAFWGGGQLHVAKDNNNYFIIAPAAFPDDASARGAATTVATRIVSGM